MAIPSRAKSGGKRKTFMNYLDAQTALNFAMKWVMVEAYVGVAHGDDSTYMPMHDWHLPFDHPVIESIEFEMIKKMVMLECRKLTEENIQFGFSFHVAIYTSFANGKS